MNQTPPRKNPSSEKNPASDNSEETDLRKALLPATELKPDRPLLSETSFFSPARILTLVLLLVLLGLGWLCFFGPLSGRLESILSQLSTKMPEATATLTLTPSLAPSPTVLAPTPSKTPTKIPTRTPLPPTSTLPAGTETPTIPAESPAATSPVSGCVPAIQVTLADVGKTMCVTGTVIRISQKPTSFSVFVENPADAFYFLSYDRAWDDLKTGQCIFATGEIKQLGDNPIMILSYQVPLELCP